MKTATEKDIERVRGMDRDQLIKHCFDLEDSFVKFAKKDEMRRLEILTLREGFEKKWALANKRQRKIVALQAQLRRAKYQLGKFRKLSVWQRLISCLRMQ